MITHETIREALQSALFKTASLYGFNKDMRFYVYNEPGLIKYKITGISENQFKDLTRANLGIIQLMHQLMPRGKFFELVYEKE